MRTLTAIVLLALLARPAWAEEASLSQCLAQFLRAPALRGARVGVVVEDLASGERLAEHLPDGDLVPASNQKLLISAASLEHWGPAHRFETPILVEGEIADGVLDGTLWIVGQGDPSLVSETLWKLAEEIRLAGVREIKGGLGVDASRFDALHFHPDWEPVSSRAYYAPVSALSANYSSFRVDVVPGEKVGAPVSLRLAPSLTYFRSAADAITLRGGGQLVLDVDVLPDGTGESVRVSGAVSADRPASTYWRAVALPERYAASLLRAQLEAQGVRVAPRVRIGNAPPEARELLRFKGEPLSLQVRLLEKFSNNFVAEQLTKILGAELYGAPGTWEKGTRAITAYLAASGISDPGQVIADGSGLSPRNRVAPATLVQVIRRAAARFDFGPEYLAALPIGGREGTLEDRMDGGAVQIRAKTGHLQRVAALTGVVPGEHDSRRVFSILVNGARGDSEGVDQAIDAFAGRIGSAPVQPGDAKTVATPPEAIPAPSEPEPAPDVAPQRDNTPPD
ncbi:MAG TPA: D-alanyl-D-alanine carboxypeptidase/D-alanyl-D-alanine-endopeptidase [Myxococcota bacterium]|nr:D-alanyl-D-alanine carboxypeptidase/D-alanyl-D-alanine-endopeptidase [Myxococcota bacterium]